VQQPTRSSESTQKFHTEIHNCTNRQHGRCSCRSGQDGQTALRARFRSDRSNRCRNMAIFWRPCVERFALCYHTVVCPILSVLSCPVCNVCILWPSGWMDQDETWHTGRPQPWQHCVRWGPSSPSPKRGRSPQFSAHVCCGQMAGWIKMPLGREGGRPQSKPHCVR